MSAMTSETWYQREVVPAELTKLTNRLCDFYGVPHTHGGTKGNEAHRNGGHRSQEWILKSAFCTNRTYTVESGLTATEARWISAFDFTPPDQKTMIAISRRLDVATRAGLLEELVEWFGTFNGKTVVGFNNITNALAKSDESHLWHVHGRRKRKLAASDSDRIFRVMTGTLEEADMQADERTWLKAVFDATFYGGSSCGTVVEKVNEQSLGNAMVDKADALLKRTSGVAATAVTVDAEAVAASLVNNKAFIESIAAATAAALAKRLEQ